MLNGSSKLMQYLYSQHFPSVTKDFTALCLEYCFDSGPFSYYLDFWFNLIITVSSNVFCRHHCLKLKIWMKFVLAQYDKLWYEELTNPLFTGFHWFSQKEIRQYTKMKPEKFFQSPSQLHFSRDKSPFFYLHNAFKTYYWLLPWTNNNWPNALSSLEHHYYYGNVNVGGIPRSCLE